MQYPLLGIFKKIHSTFIRKIALSNKTALLRGKRFIDIFSVLKETLQASVESYSLKDVEALAGLERKANLREASAARRRIAKALEFRSPDSISEQDIEIVEAYNQDDCLATAALHDFLENLYLEQSKSGQELTCPELEDGKSKDTVEEMDEEARQLFDELVKELPADSDEWSEREKAKWLLAHLVEYFRREEKSSWWEFFRLNDLEPVDLYDERKAIAGLEYVDLHPETKRVPIHNYRFPAQEISLSNGDKLYEVKGDETGTVYSISPEEGTVSIKKTAKTADQHPYAVHQKELVSATTLAASLRDFIRSVIANGTARKTSSIFNLPFP